MSGTTDMKANLLTEKSRRVIWIIATVVLIFAVQFLFAERFFWMREVRWAATDEGINAAGQAIHNERFQYLILDPGGYFSFTGELKDGIEIWNHGYVVSFPFTTPYRVHAESYVSAYNDHMESYVRRLVIPPSSVERRSEELKHEDYERRERAARLLGMMGEQAKDAIPHLIEATSDEYVEVRARAAWALGKIGPGDYREEVIAALEVVREIPNSTMQGIASRALKEVIARTEESQGKLPQL